VSDTVSQPASSPSGAPKGKRCLGATLFLLGLILLAAGGYALHVRSAIRSPEPFAFKAFKYRPLERSLLTAKFEFLQLPSRLLGSSEPITLMLDERELNALLFGDARHQDPGPKARVTIEEDRLLFTYSKPTDDGEAYVNVTATLRVTFAPPKTPGGPTVALSLLEGQIGNYTLGPITRPFVEGSLAKALNEKHNRDSRLGRIQEFSIAAGRARILFTPE
jgi:hypothetical protein